METHHEDPLVGASGFVGSAILKKRWIAGMRSQRSSGIERSYRHTRHSIFGKGMPTTQRKSLDWSEAMIGRHHAFNPEWQDGAPKRPAEAASVRRQHDSGRVRRCACPSGHALHEMTHQLLDRFGDRLQDGFPTSSD
jgi:hypothetical protein